MADLPASKRRSGNDAWHVAVLLAKGWRATIVGEGEMGRPFPRQQKPPVWVDGNVVTDYAELAAPYALLLTGTRGEQLLFPTNDGQVARELLDRATAVPMRATDTLAPQGPARNR